MSNELYHQWYRGLSQADRWAHCGNQETHEAHTYMQMPCVGTPDFNTTATSTTYRVERQETRPRHPFYGKWCQDQWTTLRDIPDAEVAIALVKNPVGPFAHQPWRVVQIVTTEKVFYTSS